MYRTWAPLRANIERQNILHYAMNTIAGIKMGHN